MLLIRFKEDTLSVMLGEPETATMMNQTFEKSSHNMTMTHFMAIYLVLILKQICLINLVFQTVDFISISSLMAKVSRMVTTETLNN